MPAFPDTTTATATATAIGPAAAPAAPEPGSPWPAVLEVLSLPLMGLIVALLLSILIGVALVNPLAGLTPDTRPDSWLPLAGGLLQVLALQYAGYLLLAAAILWPRGELNRARLGLTCGGLAWTRLLGIGLLAACLLVPMQIALLAADAHWDLGDTAPWRRALLDGPRSADYWLLMAIGSFGLVPILEELFYRGVLQGRLQQVMSPGRAIVLTSPLFALSHAQYHQANVISIATALFVFGSSLVLGWLFWKTGSLLPGIVLHAAVNVPWPDHWAGVGVAVVLLLLAGLGHRRARAGFGELQRMLMPRALGRGVVLPLLLTVAFAIGMAVASGVMIPASALMLGTALVWRRRLRRRGRVA